MRALEINSGKIKHQQTYAFLICCSNDEMVKVVSSYLASHSLPRLNSANGKWVLPKTTLLSTRAERAFCMMVASSSRVLLMTKRQHSTKN
jgi:hypothetical protein